MEHEADWQRIHTLLDLVSKKIVLPLFVDKNSPKFVGSAFLVRGENYRYVVTARHVIDEIPEELKPSLFCFVDKNAGAPIGGFHLRTSDVGLHTGGLDISVIRLDPATPEWKGDLVRDFLSLDQLNPESSGFEARLFAVPGFPASKMHIRNATDSVLKPYSIGGQSAALETYQALSLTPLTHIVMDFDQKKSYEYLNDAGTHRPPNPRGMSGSPVLDLWVDENGEAACLIVGVAIEHHKTKNAIVCTRIGTVLDMIARLEVGYQ